MSMLPRSVTYASIWGQHSDIGLQTDRKHSFGKNSVLAFTRRALRHRSSRTALDSPTPDITIVPPVSTHPSLMSHYKPFSTLYFVVTVSFHHHKWIRYGPPTKPRARISSREPTTLWSSAYVSLFTTHARHTRPSYAIAALRIPTTTHCARRLASVRIRPRQRPCSIAFWQ